MTIFEKVQDIKRRPGLYVRKETIENIFYNLLGGCISEKLIQEGKVNIDTEFMEWFGEWLNNWSSLHYDMDSIPKNIYWYNTINWLAKDEKSACRWFYYLFDIFYEEYKSRTGYFEFLK